MLEGNTKKNLPGVNSMRPEVLNEDSVIPVEAERSNELQSHSNILPEEALQIFDDRIPVRQKVTILVGVLQVVSSDAMLCVILGKTLWNLENQSGIGSLLNASLNVV